MTIRIEVSHPGKDQGSVAWEYDGPWSPEAAHSLVIGISDDIAACDRLGISLYEAMKPRASAADVEYQELSKPKFRRCLPFKVNLVVPTATPGPDNGGAA